jgi:hypothetical protein
MHNKNERADRRQFGRRLTVIHAWATTNANPQFRCIVRNISSSGALLEFPDRAPPSNTFRLIVESMGQEWACDVRHRRENFLGVAFDLLKFGDHEKMTRAATSKLPYHWHSTRRRGFSAMARRT